MILGLTGCTGSGKSSLLDYLNNHFSFWTIDLDLVGHDILKRHSVKASLVTLFGKQVMQDSGEIDRVILGNLVFSSSDSLRQLNQLVHPLIKDSVLEILRANKSLGNGVIVGALIDEIGLIDYCDHILFIDVDRAQLIRRMPHKGQIITHQYSPDSYRLFATDVLYNDFSDSFFKDGMQVFKKLLR